MQLRISSWVLALALGLSLALATTAAQSPPVLPSQPPAATPPALPPSALPPSLPPMATTPATPNVLPPVAPTPAAAPNGPAPATITVMVPANAIVSIGEQQMRQTGARRTFQSPPLDPTKTYAYMLKISWAAGPGQKDNVTEQEITIRAGLTTIIDFTPLAQAMPNTLPGQATTAPATMPPPNARTPVPQPPQPSRPSLLRRISGSKD